MPERTFLLDTGPLVAYLSDRDEHHRWAIELFQQINSSLITTEPVLTEAFYLLGKTNRGPARLADFCAAGVLNIPLRLLDELPEIHPLLQKYRNVPMDLADATLVHLADRDRNAMVITTDRDFLIYRTRSRRQIPLIAPFVT